MTPNLTEKYLIMSGLNEVSNWLDAGGLLENDSPQSSSDERDNILAGLEGTIDSLVGTGELKLRDLPRQELERIARDANVTLAPITSASTTSTSTTKEQIYLNILKKIKPRGIDAALVLEVNGENAYLKLGRATVLNGKCYIFNYNNAVTGKLFTSVTQNNLDKLQYMWGCNHEKAYVTLLYQPPGHIEGGFKAKPRYSYIVTGKRNGKDYAFYRKETGNPAAGQTRIYGPTGNIAVSNIVFDYPDVPSDIYPYARGAHGNFVGTPKKELLAKIGLG